MAITAAMVKELRDKTDAGMMDCKKALTETNGDMEAAVELLRKSGMTKAEKRADKVTKEGKVFAFVDGKNAVMLEINCETDFVAGNEKFFDFVKEAAARVLAGTTGDGDITEKAQELENGNLAELFVKFGEKMVLRRAVRYEAAAGNLVAYMHGNGRLGVLVEVEGSDDAELLKDICMHITAFSPEFITSKDIPQERVEKEKEIASAQLIAEGKPAAMIEKILVGKINKWYGEVCLMNQPWIRDDKSSLAKIAPAVTVKRFARWGVGQEA